MDNPSDAMRPAVQAPAIAIPVPLVSCSNSSSSSSPPRQSPSPTAATAPLPPPTPSTPAPPPAVVSPCAACKILRRRCVAGCVLAPYFPPTEPYKFTIAHRVFGASNIIKFLQELPESQRADAVSSMVYEANARLRDPVYGCAGAICHLQKQVSDLQAQLAQSQAELLSLRAEHTNLAALIYMEMSHHHPSQEPSINQFLDTSCFLGDDASISTWESLWA